MALQQGGIPEDAIAGILHSGALGQAVLGRLQQTAGNRAVAQIVQRDGPTTPAPAAGVTPARGPAPVPGAAPAVPEDLRRFRMAGPYPASAAGTTVLPSTGRGGFQARYDATAMVLTITVNVRINFIDGMSASGGRAVAADPSLNGAANRINRLPSSRRTAAINAWKWGGDEGTWMGGFRSSVQDAWGTAGHGLQFQCSNPGWEAQLARVNIVVNTQDASLATPPPAGASTIPATAGPTHCTANIYKTPQGNNDFGANVAPGSLTSATDQTLNLGSSQTVTHGHALSQRVLFARRSVTLDAAAQSRLLAIINSFQTPAGGAGTSIDIVGHADTTGGGTPAGDARNLQVSEQRAQAVADFLRTTRSGGGTLSNAATRIRTTSGVGSAEGGTDAAARRVDINFAGGGRQNVAAHEFGHMLGMRDEYAVDPGGVVGGSAGTTGTATDQDTAVQATDLGRSIKENNDNIMSLGGTVRAPHMVMFMEALRNVTGSNEWRLKS
jgi:outer membrane protein OmpA-like peptidoglycan-associated protein